MSSGPTDLDYLQEAFFEARRAAGEDEVPVGAIIVHEGQVVSRARNQRERLQSPISHAEIHAIEDAAKALKSWRLEGCDLYVTLEPCPMCLAACQQARIRRVFFGAKDPKGGAISLGYPLHSDPRTHHRFEVTYLEHPESSTILSDFFRAKRQRIDDAQS